MNINTLMDSDDDRPLILVVEDDVDILSFIAMELMEEYRVLQALDGKEGLELALNHLPDVVVTDLMMPVLDGLELCRSIKENPETKHIPVIMLTARTSEENQLKGLKTGADDYIVKPFNILLLKVRIENLLKSRRIMQEKHGKKYTEGQDAEFLKKAEYILEKHHSDWTFRSEELAEEFGMSLRTLQRRLKAEIGMSSGGYITKFRMKRAAEMLALTTLTITEIAFKVGYDDSSSFSRGFKKHFKVSPSEYRSKHTTS